MPAPLATKDERRRDLVRATRRIFEQRGAQEAPVEEIARSLGLARGLVYREVASKEELYVLVMVEWLADLEAKMVTARGRADGHERELRALTEAYLRFCREHPAYLDGCIALMRRPARELAAALSEQVWLALGAGMAACLGVVADVLREGTAAGVFAVEDPDLAANVLWTQALGTMHLARIGVGIRRDGEGAAGLFVVPADALVEECASAALRYVRAA